VCNAERFFVHPATGDMVECSADDLGVGPTLASLHVDACIQNFTAVGFVETDKLTPEQKAAITPSGKMLLQRRQFIPQGSSSQSAPPQKLDDGVTLRSRSALPSLASAF
jgi:hypothetical protein